VLFPPSAKSCSWSDAIQIPARKPNNNALPDDLLTEATRVFVLRVQGQSSGRISRTSHPSTVSQHWLVRPDDLSGINIPFCNITALIGFLFSLPSSIVGWCEEFGSLPSKADYIFDRLRATKKVTIAEQHKRTIAKIPNSINQFARRILVADVASFPMAATLVARAAIKRSRPGIPNDNATPTLMEAAINIPNGGTFPSLIAQNRNETARYAMQAARISSTSATPASQTAISP
jgi:hypothetical protein